MDYGRGQDKLEITVLLDISRRILIFKQCAYLGTSASHIFQEERVDDCP